MISCLWKGDSYLVPVGSISRKGCTTIQVSHNEFELFVSMECLRVISGYRLNHIHLRALFLPPRAQMVHRAGPLSWPCHGENGWNCRPAMHVELHVRLAEIAIDCCSTAAMNAVRFNTVNSCKFLEL